MGWGRDTAVVPALLRRGKTVPLYQPSMDAGSYVVVVNAEKVQVTGNKFNQKMYRRHTGRPGSLKEETFRKLQAVSHHLSDSYRQ
jgi:large subunit ribosomal protein L13